jgi:DNA (cytosine-5)-methyltransferase 1
LQTTLSATAWRWEFWKRGFLFLFKIFRHGSLFSGIGGFDLAAEWAGFENIFQVEIDPFCQKVLQKNFPKTQKYGDIKKFDGTKFRGKIDIISGGFPCQPFSCAGKRKGTEDDRHLWPEMLRIIDEIKPLERIKGLGNAIVPQVAREIFEKLK